MSHENKKLPKWAVAPPQEKEVKSKEDPKNYLTHHVSWQIGSIDLGGKWHGYLLHARFIFHLTDEITQIIYDFSLINPVDANKINSCLEDLNNKEFDSIEDFFQRLTLNSKCEIPNNVIVSLSKSITNFYFWREVFPKMKCFEKMTWDEVRLGTHGRHGKSNSHSIQVKDLGKEAQKRLRELKLDEIGALYSLRLEGRLRIFGIRKQGYLNILWIDENHEVCPTT